MEFMKPLAYGPLMGFSKPRTKSFKKPRSADSLRELVLEVKSFDFTKESEHERSHSRHLLYGLDLKGEVDSPKANGSLTARENISLPKEELLSVKRKQSAQRQASKNDDAMQSRGKQNGVLEAAMQNGNGYSNLRRLHKKVDEDVAEPIISKDLRRNGFIGNLKEKRPDRSVNGALIQEGNPEGRGAVRAKGETTRKKSERFETFVEGGASASPERLQQELKNGHTTGDTEEASLSVENRPTKLKLKVGGITHTLQTFVPAQKVVPAKTVVPGKVSQNPEASKSAIKRRRQRLILQGISDDEDNHVSLGEKPSEKLTERSCSSLNNSTLSKKVEDVCIPNRNPTLFEERTASKHSGCNQLISPSDLSARKNSRAAKRGRLDREELVIPERSRKHKRKSKIDEDELYADEGDENAALSSKREASSDADGDCLSDDEHGSYHPLNKTKHQSNHGGVKTKKAVPLTARQRALQSSKSRDTDAGASLIEFPDGLPSSSRRKQIVDLTEEEKLAKKAEIARRRKQQTEKAAKDIQASAIQKILNQDSVRRKREDRLQKQREEVAQSKKAAEFEIPSNSIRWTFGPNGNVVSWSNDLELPALFSSGPCSYPPPREKCAIPTCNNTYKYRHSRLKLPLCSLECYRMVDTPSEVGSAF